MERLGQRKLMDEVHDILDEAGRRCAYYHPVEKTEAEKN